MSRSTSLSSHHHRRRLVVLTFCVNLSLIMFVTFVATQCPTHPQLSSLVRDPTRDQCDCSYDSFSGGFEITCITSNVNSEGSNYSIHGEHSILRDVGPSHDGHQVTPHFTIKSIENKEIEVNCDDFVPDFKPAMFQGFGVDDVDTFRFTNCPLPLLPLSVILHRTSVKVHHITSSSSASESDESIDNKKDTDRNTTSSSLIPQESVSEVKSLRIAFSQPQRHPINHLKSMLNGLESLEKLILYNVAIQFPATVTTTSTGAFDNNSPFRFAGGSVSSPSGTNNGNFRGPPSTLTGPTRFFLSRNKRSSSSSSPLSFSTSFSSLPSSSFSPSLTNSESIIRSRLRLRPTTSSGAGGGVGGPPEISSSSTSSFIPSSFFSSSSTTSTTKRPFTSTSFFSSTSTSGRLFSNKPSSLPSSPSIPASISPSPILNNKQHELNTVTTTASIADEIVVGETTTTNTNNNNSPTTTIATTSTTTTTTSRPTSIVTKVTTSTTTGSPFNLHPVVFSSLSNNGGSGTATVGGGSVINSNIVTPSSSSTANIVTNDVKNLTTTNTNSEVPASSPNIVSLSTAPPSSLSISSFSSLTPSLSSFSSESSPNGSVVTTTTIDPLSVDESINVNSFNNLLNLNSLIPKLKSLLLDTFFVSRSDENVEGNSNNLENSLLLRGMCRELKYLESVQLRNNLLPVLIDETFKEASASLKRLYFIGNGIKRISSKAFSGLRELQVLDLFNNNLTSLHEDVFQDLNNLIILRLGKNNFQSLPSRLLRHTRHLTSLDLSQSRNLTTPLPSNFLSDNRELMNFTMTDTPISDISVNSGEFFASLPSLEKIEMRGGRLRNLTAIGLFGRNSNLRKIDLSYNDISSISPLIFSTKSSSIVELNLYGNELTTIDVGMFDSLKNLRILKLGFNNIQSLSPELFFPLRKLEELDLSRNRLMSVNPQRSRLPFGLGTAYLRKLNFSKNNISDFSEFNVIDWSLYLKIADINLSGNRIRSTIRLPVFHSTVGHVILDLTNNLIESVDMSEIVQYESLVLQASRDGMFRDDLNGSPSSNNNNNKWKLTQSQPLPSSSISQVIIRLDNNPLRCDCHLEPFIAYANKSSSSADLEASFRGILNRVSFDFYSNDLKCSKPNNLAGLPIHQINIKNLSCNITSQRLCPRQCSCLYRAFDKQAIIDCQDRGLSNIPESIVSNPMLYKNMTLESNGVTTPPYSKSTVDALIVTILLNNNFISNIDVLSTILYPSSSTTSSLISFNGVGGGEPLSFHLYLDNNRIRELPTTRMRKIHHLNNYNKNDENNNGEDDETVSGGDPIVGDGVGGGTESPSDEHIQWASSSPSVSSVPTPSTMVTVLSLRNNMLTKIPLTFLQMFGQQSSPQTPQPQTNNSRRNIIVIPRRQLFLGHNPYNCSFDDTQVVNSVNDQDGNNVDTCQLIAVKSWLTKNYDIVPDVKDISCVDSNGEQLGSGDNKRPLLDMPDTELCPLLLQSSTASGILFISIFCLVMSIVLVLICIAYYRNKQTILAFIYIHINPVFVCLHFSEDDIDEDKTYDAFVSYSSSDRDIVMEMIEKLEAPTDQSLHSISFLKQQSGMPSIHEGHSDQIVPEHSVQVSPSTKSSSQTNGRSGRNGTAQQPQDIKENKETNNDYYTLCIHERDWLPGNLISWNIVNSVQNSRRTILILSKEFIRSIWFQVEFHTAYYQMLEDKMDRLIVIVKGELPPKEELDKDLVFLLTTKTYLVWGEKWFWEKLRYALPHKNRHRNVHVPLLKSKNPLKSSVSPHGTTKQSKADIMREYVDQTISDHFQLRAKSRPTNSSNDSSKRGRKPNSNANGGNNMDANKQMKGHINESFVLETET